MDADNDMRAPLFEEILKVPKAAFVKELSGLRTKSIDRPIEILHPTLLITQDPVI
jgi:hypothetical protein